MLGKYLLCFCLVLARHVITLPVFTDHPFFHLFDFFFGKLGDGYHFIRIMIGRERITQIVLPAILRIHIHITVMQVRSVRHPKQYRHI